MPDTPETTDSLGAAGAPDAAPDTAGTPDTYDTLARVLTANLGRPAAAVTPRTALDDLHLDSLALLELSVALTEELGVHIAGVDRTQTLAELSGRLDELMTAQAR